MAKHENIVVGLDIGTTKICAVAGERVDEKRMNIIGIGTVPSKGVKNGMVIHIDSTVESITRAVEEAERMAGVEIRSVYAGISGRHVRGLNGHGVIAIKDGEISEEDVERVLNAAKVVPVQTDRKILHVIPQEFIVDGQDGIKSPLRMSGVRLEAGAYIITAAVTAAQNLMKCIQGCRLEVDEMILQPLASSEAVLTAEEKDLGVVVLDIGGGTTDLAIFMDGAIRHIAVLPLGGNHLTNDIAIGIRTTTLEAEKIKIRQGCALTDLVKESETIEVPRVVEGRPPRMVPRQTLSEIIEPRMEEIFSLAYSELEKGGLDEKIPAGVVLTGGTALMSGIVELAEQVFNLPTRVGVPSDPGGLIDMVRSPLYATAVGLILYAGRNQDGTLEPAHRNRNVMNRMTYRVKEWFKEFF